MSEQAVQLSRVKGKIKPAILAFYCHRKATKQLDFHADELRQWVLENHNVAPASPDRVLRDLRQSGELDYVVEKRSQSLYRFL